MTDQQALNFALGAIQFLFGIVGAGVAWWVNNLWMQVKQLTELLAQTRLEMAQKYVLREEMEKRLDKMDAKLDRIIDSMSVK